MARGSISLLLVSCLDSTVFAMQLLARREPVANGTLGIEGQRSVLHAVRRRADVLGTDPQRAMPRCDDPGYVSSGGYSDKTFPFLSKIAGEDHWGCSNADGGVGSADSFTTDMSAGYVRFWCHFMCNHPDSFLAVNGDVLEQPRPASAGQMPGMSLAEVGKRELGSRLRSAHRFEPVSCSETVVQNGERLFYFMDKVWVFEGTIGCANADTSVWYEAVSFRNTWDANDKASYICELACDVGYGQNYQSSNIPNMATTGVSSGDAFSMLQGSAFLATASGKLASWPAVEDWYQVRCTDPWYVNTNGYSYTYFEVMWYARDGIIACSQKQDDGTYRVYRAEAFHIEGYFVYNQAYSPKYWCKLMCQ